MAPAGHAENSGENNWSGKKSGGNRRGAGAHLGSVVYGTVGHVNSWIV